MKRDTAARRKKYEAPAIARVSAGSCSSKIPRTSPQAMPSPAGSIERFRIVLDREGRFRHTARKFCDLLGYEPEHLLGKSINEVTVTGTVNLPQHLAVVAQFGHFPGLWMFACPAGQAILVRCDWKLLEDGSIEAQCELLAPERAGLPDAAPPNPR